MQGLCDPHAGRHIEHAASPMKRCVHCGKPIAAGFDDPEPMRPEAFAVLGQQSLRRPEQHAPSRQIWSQFIPQHMTVDRPEPSGDRRSDGLRGGSLVERIGRFLILGLQEADRQR